MRAYAKLLRASLSFVLLTPCLNAYAQSGRNIPPPPAPTTAATPPDRPDTKRRPVIGGGDEYKLVFTTVYDGKRYYRMDKERKELALATRSELENFIEQLNKVGQQGYKLTSAIDRGFPVGLARFDQAQYEYMGFDTTSNFFFAVGGFEEKYAGLARRGFRLAEHFFVGSYCEYLDPDNSALGQNCEFTRRFLLEREKGVEKPRPHVFVGSAPGWRSKPSAELSNRINKGLSEGFYPTSVLSKFEILLEHGAKSDESLNDKTDAQIVTSSRPEELAKKVNEFAKQGYRLALTDDGIALMYRREGAATPVAYVWLKTKDKSFEKQLAKLQQSGAAYRMTYPDNEGNKNSLVFEQNPANQALRREYKVLKFEFKFVENAAERKMHIALAPSSKETMKTLNGLVKEGFTVRDLFVSDEVSVLLERLL